MFRKEDKESFKSRCFDNDRAFVYIFKVYVNFFLIPFFKVEKSFSVIVRVCHLILEIFWWIYMRVRVLKMLVTEIFFLKFFWVAWRHKFDGNFFWSFLIFKTWFLKLLPIAHCFEIFEDFRVNSYASGSF